MKTTRILAYSLIAMTFFSCEKGNIDSIQITDNGEFNHSSVLSATQLEQFATLYAGVFQSIDSTNSVADTKASATKVLENVDVLVENGDTLMYAFNYRDNGGYIVIGADNSHFPILAHASTGSFRFSNIEKNNPINIFLECYKTDIKDRRNNETLLDSEFYDNWKDLGKEGYEYVVEICTPEEIQETKSRRTESSGKATVYPFTGMELSYWCQEGGYNYYAENNACIGCPAISIGMLMYDTASRITGNCQQTYPSFGYYYDAFDMSGYTTGTPTAQKLRQIADAIPNYNWGAYAGAESGAQIGDIVTGLHNLGYVNAVAMTYNFETLYNNLKFTGYNYFGELTTFNRGVLLYGRNPYTGGGHIWFCDGYYEQSYTVTKKFLGIVISQWTEYDDRLYMNWGWGPDGGNGWYCATDSGYYWSSLDGTNVYLRYAPGMVVNLSTYVYPSEY